MAKFLFFAGLLLFALACRTFSFRHSGKLAWLAVFAATYTGVFFLTESHAWAGASLLVWPLLPWLEIIARVRKLKFPLHNEIKNRFPPSRDIFPDLECITDEVEAAGFVQADDAGWKWDETDHFVRLFYHSERRLTAAISVAQQSGFIFSYASLTSRTITGMSFVTTNYPFSFTMRVAPLQRTHRCEGAESFEEMIQAHELFLKRHHIKKGDVPPLDPDLLQISLAKDLTQQIDHNLDEGLIIQMDEVHFRYSWRGCCYLWLQVVKDALKT